MIVVDQVGVATITISLIYSNGLVKTLTDVEPTQVVL